MLKHSGPTRVGAFEASVGVFLFLPPPAPEDEDVKEVFRACEFDFDSLRVELNQFLKDKLNDLINPNLVEVKPTLGFQLFNLNLRLL